MSREVWIGHQSSVIVKDTEEETDEFKEDTGGI